MKIANLICNEYGHPLKEGDRSYTYTHLIIENTEDVNRYQDAYMPLTAEKNVNALFGFKSQNFRSSLSDYLAHEGINTAPETSLLAVKLALKETDTSIVDVCRMSDDIMIHKIMRIYKWIDEGYMVRINNKGGYCYIDTLQNYDSFFEPTDKQLATFINTGKVIDLDFEITKPTIVIENAQNVNDTFLNKIYSYIPASEIQIINMFKARTIGFKDKDYIEIFSNGIKNGMRNICFQTTGQDFHNIQKLHFLLMGIVKMNPSINFKLYFDTYNDKVKKLFISKDNLTTILIDKNL